MATKSMDELVALCKRRGFIFPASEIYGGINGFWDFGPLGTELKNNIRDAWWDSTVKRPPLGPDGEVLSMVGVDTAIIQNPTVWEASGHVGGFNDPNGRLPREQEPLPARSSPSLQTQVRLHRAHVRLRAGEPEPALKKLKKRFQRFSEDDFEILPANRDLRLGSRQGGRSRRQQARHPHRAAPSST